MDVLYRPCRKKYFFSTESLEHIDIPIDDVNNQKKREWEVLDKAKEREKGWIEPRKKKKIMDIPPPAHLPEELAQKFLQEDRNS